VWVSLDACSSVWDYDRDNYLTATSDELVEEMRERLSYLREVFGEERDARGRADTFIAQLIQANAALAVRVPELEKRRPVRTSKAPSWTLRSLSGSLRGMHRARPGGRGRSRDEPQSCKDPRPLDCRR
jgi:hypothetical protein